MEILYNDEHIVVCVKPAGVLSAADLSGKANMNALLRDELGADEIFTVHRLDKEVSGVMVYAKTQKAASALSQALSDHTRFVKEYYAVVSGKPNESSGILEDLLYKDTKRSKSYVVKTKRRGVKSAKLEYELLCDLGDCSLLKVRLFTGRTHQIRVQFASRGMALLGDRKYGGAKNEKGLALRSSALTFFHPVTNQCLRFEKIPEINDMI